MLEVGWLFTCDRCGDRCFVAARPGDEMNARSGTAMPTGWTYRDWGNVRRVLCAKCAEGYRKIKQDYMANGKEG